MSFLPQFLRAWTNSLIVGSFAKVLKYSSRHSVGLLPSACIKFNLSEWTFSSLPTLRHVLRVQVSLASSCVWTYLNKVPFSSHNISIWETWMSTWQKEKEGNKYFKLFGTCSIHNFEVCTSHINKFPDLETFVSNHLNYAVFMNYRCQNFNCIYLMCWYIHWINGWSKSSSIWVMWIFIILSLQYMYQYVLFSSPHIKIYNLGVRFLLLTTNYKHLQEYFLHSSHPPLEHHWHEKKPYFLICCCLKR